jgi:hypothetical protein
MKVTRRQLRKIIREAFMSRGSKQDYDISGFTPNVDDIEFEEWKILFPEHRGGQFSPLREQWHEWFDSLKPGFNNRFDPALEVLGISYDYPEAREGYHSAKVRVQGRNRYRFTSNRPPRDPSGYAYIKLVKRR